MKEKILEALSDLDFKTEYVESFGYHFVYEGRNMLYMPNKDDDTFLMITVPAIFDCEDKQTVEQAHNITQKLNSMLEYIKAYIFFDSVWLTYEREILSEDDDLQLAIAHMVQRLDRAFVFAQKTINDIVNAETDDSDECTTSKKRKET